MNTDIKKNESAVKSQKRSLFKRLSTWQKIAILGSIIVFIWGIVVFYYINIHIPESAPVNITLDRTLQKGGICAINRGIPKKALEAIEIKVTAKNPGSRIIYLLPSAFIVYGNKVEPSNLTDNDFIKQISSSPINSLKIKHSKTTKKSSPITVGRLLTDTTIKPNEILKRSYIFEVPCGEYDVLEAHAVIFGANNSKKIDIEWKYNKESNILIPSFFRIDADGKRTLMKTNNNWEFLNENDKSLAKQIALTDYPTISSLSLW